MWLNPKAIRPPYVLKESKLPIQASLLGATPGLLGRDCLSRTPELMPSSRLKPDSALLGPSLVPGFIAVHLLAVTSGPRMAVPEAQAVYRCPKSSKAIIQELRSDRFNIDSTLTRQRQKSILLCERRNAKTRYIKGVYKPCASRLRNHSARERTSVARRVCASSATVLGPHIISNVSSSGPHASEFDG